MSHVNSESNLVNVYSPMFDKENDDPLYTFVNVSCHPGFGIVAKSNRT